MYICISYYKIIPVKVFIIKYSSSTLHCWWGEFWFSLIEHLHCIYKLYYYVYGSVMVGIIVGYCTMIFILIDILLIFSSKIFGTKLKIKVKMVYFECFFFLIFHLIIVLFFFCFFLQYANLYELLTSKYRRWVF